MPFTPRRAGGLAVLASLTLAAAPVLAQDEEEPAQTETAAPLSGLTIDPNPWGYIENWKKEGVGVVLDCRDGQGNENQPCEGTLTATVSRAVQRLLKLPSRTIAKGEITSVADDVESDDEITPGYAYAIPYDAGWKKPGFKNVTSVDVIVSGKVTAENGMSKTVRLKGGWTSGTVRSGCWSKLGPEVSFKIHRRAPFCHPSGVTPPTW